MPRTPEALLLNSRGQLTRHVFTHLHEGEDGLCAMFRCLLTDAERVFGCVRSTLTKAELEDEFGPLDDHMRARRDDAIPWSDRACNPNARREGAVEEAA